MTLLLSVVLENYMLHNFLANLEFLKDKQSNIDLIYLQKAWTLATREGSRGSMLLQVSFLSLFLMWRGGVHTNLKRDTSFVHSVKLNKLLVSIGTNKKHQFYSHKPQWYTIPTCLQINLCAGLRFWTLQLSPNALVDTSKNWEMLNGWSHRVLKHSPSRHLHAGVLG